MAKIKTTGVRKAVALLALGVMGAAAQSAYAVDFDGYFRAGPATTSKDSARACYNLAGTSFGGHYRLGNECDFYGEFGLSQTGTVDGVQYRAKVMFNEYNGGTDVGNSSTAFEQMYVEAKGYDIAPNTNFWVGKRFYGRNNVDFLDHFFVNMSGVGAGADQISVGSGKLGIAYFSSDNGSPGAGGNGGALTGTSTNPGNRINVDLTDLTVNPGGKLRVTGTFTQGHFNSMADGKGTSGVALSLQHDQALPGIGGSNTAWLQYAQGSASLDQNFGTMTASSSVKAWRLIESLQWQLGPFGGQAAFVYGQHDKDTLNMTPEYKEMTIGGRGAYALTHNFKMLVEAGYVQRQSQDGTPTQKLTKLTIAPTLAVGPAYWNRPELRFYVTTAKWNQPANAVAGVAGLTGLGNKKTSGTSFGFQAETWF